MEDDELRFTICWPLYGDPDLFSAMRLAVHVRELDDDDDDDDDDEDEEKEDDKCTVT